MNTPRTTAKDFFLWAGAMVSFYWSVIAFILLIFNYINYALPNPLQYYPADPYQSGISGEMASVIVLFPLYLFLMQLIHKDINRDATKKDIWVRRWAVIFTLFVAGIAMAADLITLLTTFLNGEALTAAFILKVIVVFLVAAGVFMHFIADLKGYWDAYPSRRRTVGIGVGVLALATIIAGFFIVGTPQEARLARFDDAKVADLQNIQSQVVSYWQAKRALPVSLIDLTNSLQYGQVPTDPQTGAAYGYQTAGPLTFKLCADFNQPSRGTGNAPAIPAAPGFAKDTWQHGAGQTCFSRTIDPSFYPPLTK